MAKKKRPHKDEGKHWPFNAFKQHRCALVVVLVAFTVTMFASQPTRLGTLFSELLNTQPALEEPRVGIDEDKQPHEEATLPTQQLTVNMRSLDEVAHIEEERNTPTKPTSSRIDKNGNCPAWAASGECEKNPRYMAAECLGSCPNLESPNQATPEPIRPVPSAKDPWPVTCAPICSRT